MQITVNQNALYTAEPDGTLRTSTPNNDPQSGVPGSYPEITPNVTSIGSTTFSPVWPTMASIYSDGGVGSDFLQGVPGLFNISDMTSMSQHPVDVLVGAGGPTGSTGAIGATGATSGAYVSSEIDGFRGCQVVVYYSDPSNVCDIDLYAVINSTDTLMKTWTGVTYADTQGLYCGHNDSINLKGYPIFVQVQNITAGHVNVGITPMS